jgi:hypothetical protein
MHLHISIDQSRPRTESCSNLLATLGPRLFDLFQAHFSVAEFGTDRTAEEAILIENMYLSHVGRFLLVVIHFPYKSRIRA